MKSEDLKCNKVYWSKRLNKLGLCSAFTDYMVYIIFIDNKDNGWYHCSELEEIKSNERTKIHKVRQ